MALQNGDNIVHVECLKSQLANVAISNGQLIYTSDSEELFWDTNGSRKKITDVIILTNESAKNDILAPLSKLYYVIEGNSLYYYNSGWIKVNSGESLDSIVYVGSNPSNNPKIWIDTSAQSVQVYSVSETDMAIQGGVLGFTNSTITKDTSGTYPKYTEVTDTYTLVTEKTSDTSWKETLTWTSNNSVWIRITSKNTSTNKWTTTITKS